MITILPFALACSISLLSPAAAAQEPGEASEAAAGSARADAMAAVERLRELDPDAPDALARASELLGQAGDEDSEIAYLLLAIDAYESLELDDEQQRSVLLRPLEKRLAKLDTGMGPLRGYRDTYLKGLSFALRLYAGNQDKPRSALEIGGRMLRYRPDHPTALRVVEDLLDRGDEDDRREARRLLGLRELSRPRSFLAAWLRQHGSWARADSLVADEYVVQTDIGYDVMQKAARGLDQIAVFYRRFYGTDRRLQIGKTKVRLCKRRADFEAVAQNPITQNPGLLAFISAMVRTTTEGASTRTEIEFSIYGYDPRDVGRPLESLWPVLWHEASHQYMKLAMQGEGVPPWLDEGMASYFEGARVAHDGKVDVGLPARERLDDLHAMLSAGVRPLADLLAERNGLRNDLYPVAWGLVYYLHHTRDAEGATFMRPLLRGAIEQLAAGASAEDGRALFESSVLIPLGQDLEAFESAWIEGILALHLRESAPAELARELAALGRQHLEAGRPDAAREVFLESRLRDPGLPDALLGLSTVALTRWEAARKKDNAAADDVLRWARRAHNAASASGDEDLTERAAELAQAVDRAGFKKVIAAEQRYRKKVGALITRQVEAGRPRTALAIAQRFVDDVLDEPYSESLAARFRDEGTLKLERRRRIFDGETLVGLAAGPSAFTVEDGTIVGRCQRPERAPLLVELPVAPLFRLEAELSLSSADTVLGVTYSASGATGVRGFALRPTKPSNWKPPADLFVPFDRLVHGRIADLQEGYVPEFKMHDYSLELPGRPLALEPGQWAKLELSRPEHGSLVLAIDGHEVARRSISAVDGDVSVGFLLYGGELRVRQLAVVELDRL